MPHRSRLAKLVIDAPPTEHRAELDFWSGAFGLEFTSREESPQYHGADLPYADFRILIQRLDDGEPRIHLDVHTDDLDAEVARLEAFGARRVRRIDRLWILLDPMGVPFCVIEDDGLHDGNSTRWP